MNIKLWYNLYRTKKQISPNEKFKRELGSMLSKKFDDVYGKEGFWHSYILVRTSRIVMASAVGFSMLGTSAYAYVSPDVTEGSLLYPVKIGLEKVEEQTKISPESKVKFIIKKAERREAEKQVLVAKIEEQKHRASARNNTEDNSSISTSSDEIIANQELSSSSTVVVMVTSTTSTVDDSIDSNEDSDRNLGRGEINKENQKIEKSKSTFSERMKKIIGDKQVISEVKKSEVHIQELDNQLKDVKDQLKDDEEGKKLKELIEQRLEKSRQQEQEIQKKIEEQNQEKKDKENAVTEQKNLNKRFDRSGFRRVRNQSVQTQPVSAPTIQPVLIVSSTTQVEIKNTEEIKKVEDGIKVDESVGSSSTTQKFEEIKKEDSGRQESGEKTETESHN